MAIENEVFRKTLIDKDKLIPFGFEKKGNSFFYRETFMNGQFSAEIEVDEKVDLKGHVWDNDADEEYIQVHINNITGEFVSLVREGYEMILKRIKDECTIPQQFLFPQSNRISNLIRERYGETPDFPFKKLEDYGVFRYPGNGKWYGLIMNIPFNKMFASDDESLIEIINVKIDVKDRDRLLNSKGIYDCYHMNKNSWVSIVLDDTLNDKRIMELIDDSRNLIIGRNLNLQNNTWLVPANPKYYDIDTAFKKRKGVDWKQGKGIRKDDTVYMYVGSPVSAVRYKCTVTKTDIPFVFENDEVRMTRLMKMDVLQEYRADYCPFEKLKRFNVNAVRGPRRIDEKLKEYLDNYNEQIKRD